MFYENMSWLLHKYDQWELPNYTKHFSSLIYYHDKDLVVSLHVLVETVNQFKQNLVSLF